jgi:photosystem II stability/assembly factor-like uncharacterized protein
MYRNILILIVLLGSQVFYAQNPVLSTRSQDRDINGVERQYLADNSRLGYHPIDNIGPTVMSGRVTDLEVNPNDPTEFYVAYASGGLWHTTNNGTTFKPIFDYQPVMTIGDIAIDWNSRTIYVGTGEVNSSRSSYAGNGIYKSNDNGETWVYLGLPESHHIGRIVIDSANSQRILVGVLGHLYSSNNERGIYLTEDGGKTWNLNLFINENTGCVDLIQDPQNTEIFYAVMWQRERRAWNFVESGPGSGIYKSNDGGLTWNLISTESSGFPNNEGVGRIGLDITYNNNTPYLYAFLDNYNRRPPESKEEKEGLTKEDFKVMDKESFENLAIEELESYLKDNGFPEKYGAEAVKEMVQSGKIEPVALAEYLEDANSLLFDTDVIGAQLYLSKDGGKTFVKTHDGYIDRLVNSYGYYFGQVRVEPKNPAVVYIMGVPILKSEDYGKTWISINKENVHVDHHALWINPQDVDHLINGNDGGVNISYDKGESWIKCNSPAVGQFYAINVDNAKPYKVYAGAQDNGVWAGSHKYKHNVSWHQTGKYPYQSLMGGDGMQIQIDSRDNNTTYTGFQFGNYFRIDQKTGKRSYITPKHELGDRPYRWNWQSPILLSTHNQDILYMGANKLLRSMDQGETFTEISDDLTFGGKKGDVAFGTLVSIDESRFTFGKIVVGSDDGRVHLTEDGGVSWTEIGSGLPKHLWVSRVRFSRHDDQIIYLTLNGYRWDDFNAYVYKSTDNGLNWDQIGLNLPPEPVNVILEDSEERDIVYLGTDHGLYISYNGGQEFERFSNEMPHVPVHDLVIQERDEDLLVATHGRSIYRIDLEEIRKLKGINELYLFDLAPVNYSENWGKIYTVYRKPNVPVMKYKVYAPQAGEGQIKVYFNGKEIFEQSLDFKKGLAEYEYDFSVLNSKKAIFEKVMNKDKAKKEAVNLKPGDNGVQYLTEGTYKMEVQLNNKSVEAELKIVNPE